MFKKQMKKLDMWDVAMIKWGSALGILFLITVWPAFRELVLKVHWGWFLGAMILVIIRPIYRAWIKK